MNAYRTLLNVVGLVLLLGTVANAQDSDSKKTAMRFKRAQRVIQTVYALSRTNSDLEIVESQRELIKATYDRYRDVLASSKNTPKEEREIVRLEMTDRLVSLERELLTEVLLPEQSEAIQNRVFAKQVQDDNGNFIRTITQKYADQLDLSDDEMQRLDAIEKEAGRRIAEARKRFEEELKAVVLSVREDLKGTLSEDQMKLIDDLDFQTSQSKKQEKRLLKEKQKLDKQKSENEN